MSGRHFSFSDVKNVELPEVSANFEQVIMG